MGLTLAKLDDFAELMKGDPHSRWSEVIEYARERAAREACEAAVAGHPGFENGPTLFGYDTQDGGRFYVAHYTHTGPSGRRGKRYDGMGDTPTAAYLALLTNLEER